MKWKTIENKMRNPSHNTKTKKYIFISNLSKEGKPYEQKSIQVFGAVRP